MLGADHGGITSYVIIFQAGRWQSSGSLGLGRTLYSLTLGIWGYGKIGKRIAQYAKIFGMNVLVWGSDESRLAAEQGGFSAASVTYADSLSGNSFSHRLTMGFCYHRN